MATRFYLPSATVSQVNPPFESGYTNTASALRRKMVTTKLGEAFGTQSILTSAGATGETHLFRQYVSAPLDAQTISGTATGQIRCAESNGLANAFLGCLCKVVSNDGQTLRGSLFGGTVPNLASHELAVGTLTNRPMTDSSESVPMTLTSVDAQAGDRLVLELFVVEVTSNTTYSLDLEFGDASSTDLAGSGDLTETTQNNPWLEFSQNLTFQGENVTSTPPAGSLALTDLASSLNWAFITAAGAQSITGLAASALITELHVNDALIVISAN